MKPALSAEEWAQQSFTRGDPDNVHITRRDGVVELDLQHSGNSGYPSPETRHAIAAIMLDGLPCGFTREDVEDISNAAFAIRRFGGNEPWQRRLEAISARVKALVPTE